MSSQLYPEYVFCLYTKIVLITHIVLSNFQVVIRTPIFTHKMTVTEVFDHAGFRLAGTNYVFTKDKIHKMCILINLVKVGIVEILHVFAKIYKCQFNIFIYQYKSALGINMCIFQIGNTKYHGT